MDRARLLTERADADYNKDIENINEDRGGQDDYLFVKNRYLKFLYHTPFIKYIY